MAELDDASRPRVFLSHVRDPASDRVRERLVEALEHAGYAVWRGVETGQEPGPARGRYVAEADGAVAIVPRGALRSEWLLAEVRLLRERAASDASFALVLLPVDGIDGAALRGGPYEPLMRFAGWRRCSTRGRPVRRREAPPRSCAMPSPRVPFRRWPSPHSASARA